MGLPITHSGIWTVDDRISSPWHYLPVEVGAGIAAMRVGLSFDHSAGAVLDLGVFGPGGFRGWSGGARDAFALTASAATPGYLPGPVEAGLWQVVIGLHAVPAEGVRYQVTTELFGHGQTARTLAAELAPGVAPPVPGERPARRSLPAAAGRRWLAGDLHAHTVHSDGSMTVPELAVLAVRRGLDFVAVTDHNTVSHHAWLASASALYGVVLVPGQEVTTANGHANVFGPTGWVDFRSPASAWLSSAEIGGGLMSVNHPFAGPTSWLHPMERRPPLLEVWHWSWLDLTWTTPLSWWQAWDPSAIPVGGSDWHREGSDAPLGTPTTWVECADGLAGGGDAGGAGGAGDAGGGIDAILDGLRAGRVAISAGRDGPVLLRVDGELVAVGADGLLLADPGGPYRRIVGDVVRFPGRDGYHRLITSAGATLALTP
jgi:hypothetical protein